MNTNAIGSIIHLDCPARWLKTVWSFIHETPLQSDQRRKALGDMGKDVTLQSEDLTGFIERIFRAAGADGSEAEAIATHLVDANLAGHDSHGVVRVPRYLEGAAKGQMKFGQTAEVITQSDTFALLDGQNGFGQVLGRQAVELGVEKAKQEGTAVIGLKNSGHLGRIGALAELACAQGIVSIHFVNVAQSMLVAPFGGAERRISTAPVAIGFPNENGDDFLLDFATSKIAEGKALVALNANNIVPMGSLVDGSGQPTHDPAVLYGDVPAGGVPNPRHGPGALLPMGDHKGSGLALACELLAGALTGSGTTGPGSAPHNGMLSIFIAPGAFQNEGGLPEAVNSYIEFVRSAAPTDTSKPVQIPGDPERAKKSERLANGVPLSAETWESLKLAAQTYQIPETDFPAPRPKR
ncbi:MAG: malate/lactate/ureidoglycolate dehydrogenase [Hyphomicrobiales bacterium]